MESNTILASKNGSIWIGNENVATTIANQGQKISDNAKNSIELVLSSNELKIHLLLWFTSH